MADKIWQTYPDVMNTVRAMDQCKTFEQIVALRDEVREKTIEIQTAVYHECVERGYINEIDWPHLAQRYLLPDGTNHYLAYMTVVLLQEDSLADQLHFLDQKPPVAIFVATRDSQLYMDKEIVQKYHPVQILSFEEAQARGMPATDPTSRP